MKSHYLSAFLSSLVLLFSASAYSSSSIEALRKTALRLEAGSGSIVVGPSGKKYLLTNSHVCAVSRWKGTIKATYEGGAIVQGQIIKDSFTADLCAVSVDKSLPGLPIGSNLRPGSEVCTRGYPAGILTESCGKVGGLVMWRYTYPIAMLGECPPETTKEYSSEVGRLVGCTINQTSILTSLYARGGSSGSPVVNTAGELVGVISDWQPGQETEAGMVPLSKIKAFMGDL